MQLEIDFLFSLDSLNSGTQLLNLLPGLPVTLFGDIRISLIQCSTKPNQINFMVSRPLLGNGILRSIPHPKLPKKVAGVRGGGLGVGGVRG